MNAHEFLADLEVALENGFGNTQSFISLINAIKAVVDLHQPLLLKNDSMLYCQGCCGCENSGAYPYQGCKTLEIIAKEVNNGMG